MRKRNGAFSLQQKLSSFDIYGHHIGVTYQGQSFFKTKMGGVLSIMSFTLVLIYSIYEMIAYMQVSDPNVISMVSRIDRRSTDEIKFSENQFDLAFEFV